MAKVTFTVELDDAADPPVVRLDVDRGTGPVVASSLQPAQLVELLDAVDQAAGPDVTSVLRRAIADAGTRLQQRLDLRRAEVERLEAAQAQWPASGSTPS